MLVQDDIAVVVVVLLPTFELNAAFSDGFIVTGTQ